MLCSLVCVCVCFAPLGLLIKLAASSATYQKRQAYSPLSPARGGFPSKLARGCRAAATAAGMGAVGHEVASVGVLGGLVEVVVLLYEPLELAADVGHLVGDTDEGEDDSVQVKTETGGSEGSINLSDEIVSETAESLEQALKNLANTHGRENVYLEFPKLDIDELIVDNQIIHGLCKTAASEIPANDSEVPVEYSMVKFIEDCKVDFVKFKRSAQKEVNYLVKEFECKKSAGTYARATTSRTGVLDTSNLVNYKFSEDLFKKVTTLAELASGKEVNLEFDVIGKYVEKMVEPHMKKDSGNPSKSSYLDQFIDQPKY